MSVIIENESFKLTLGDNCIAESLICKETDTECIETCVKTPFFFVTELRPYNNEIKLDYPTKETVFNANSVRREGNRLIVGFELISYEAIIELTISPEYVTFTLVDFITNNDKIPKYDETEMPINEVRLIQLPVANRENFGRWLNVVWDDKAAVNVLAPMVWTKIDSEERDGYKILTADALADIKLRGAAATLIVTTGEKLLDAVEKVEEDYDLPRGVASRRSDSINASSYWVGKLTPENIDEHIKYAKLGGFKMLLTYYSTAFKNEYGRVGCGAYEWADEINNDPLVLKAMLDKIKANGITPGIHLLQTYVGVTSKYVTPVADHRLGIKRYFTLSKPLGTDDDTVYVEENPQNSVMAKDRRVLKFGGELIYYTGYTTEPPYAFTGCTRGYLNTNVITHEIGQIGGILDLSEYSAECVYINQNTSLPDELADRLAELYNLGFEFVYFDGSEGASVPYEIHVSNSQYRLYKKLGKKPLYCEGAAKSHFGWHILSGGNAYDGFPAEVFKKKLAQYQMGQAPRMAMDFTRINFGWWDYTLDSQPDLFEYGTSHAAGWDCPCTIGVWSRVDIFAEESRDIFKQNPRTVDNLEVIRRWEEARRLKLLTKEQKEMLKNPDKEFTMLINERGEYELVEYKRIKLNESIDKLITAYTFDRADGTYVVIWNTKGSTKLYLDLNVDVTYKDELAGKEIAIERDGKGIVIEVANKRYFKADCEKNELIRAFETAKNVN